MQRFEECMVGITTWAHDVFPTCMLTHQYLYQTIRPFMRSKQIICKPRTCGSDLALMDTYFAKQDQALANRRAEMRTLWATQNKQFQEDLNNYFNSCNMWLRSFFISLFVLWFKEEYKLDLEKLFNLYFCLFEINELFYFCCFFRF